MTGDLLTHDGETFYCVRETIDTRIFISDNSKRLLVLDRYDAVLGEVTCYTVGNEAFLDVENI